MLGAVLLTWRARGRSRRPAARARSSRRHVRGACESVTRHALVDGLWDHHKASSFRAPMVERCFTCVFTMHSRRTRPRGSTPRRLRVAGSLSSFDGAETKVQTLSEDGFPSLPTHEWEVHRCARGAQMRLRRKRDAGGECGGTAGE
eukprot:493192-Rhodomonas_salina.2